MWPALISAGANILGGLMSSSSMSSANAANMAMAQENLDFQKQMATTGVSMKAADARNAEAKYGINPLVSMGASTFSPSPVSAGQVGDSSLGSSISSAGQDVSRAAEAMSANNVRKSELENKLLEAQIAKMNADTVKEGAVASQTAVRAQTKPAVGNLYQQFRDPDGNIVTLPSDKASTSLQNIASWPSNLAVGADMLSRNLGIRHPWRDSDAWLSSHGFSGVRGDVWRNVDPKSYNYVPF